MSVESTDRICLKSTIPTNAIHKQLKIHTDLFEPPYDIQSILSIFSCEHGVPFQISIQHTNKEISIAQPCRLPTSIQKRIRKVKSQKMHSTLHHQWCNVPPVSQSVSEPSELSCSICLEKISTHQLYCLPVCEHIFHERCFSRWEAQANSCPLCRTPLVSQ